MFKELYHHPSTFCLAQSSVLLSAMEPQVCTATPSAEPSGGITAGGGGGAVWPPSSAGPGPDSFLLQSGASTPPPSRGGVPASPVGSAEASLLFNVRLTAADVAERASCRDTAPPQGRAAADGSDCFGLGGAALADDSTSFGAAAAAAAADFVVTPCAPSIDGVLALPLSARLHLPEPTWAMAARPLPADASAVQVYICLGKEGGRVLPGSLGGRRRARGVTRSWGGATPRTPAQHSRAQAISPLQNPIPSSYYS